MLKSLFLFITIGFFILISFFSGRYRKIMYFLSLLLLFFLSAFRDPLLGGIDAIIYKRYFENIVPSLKYLFHLQTTYYEVGYYWLNLFVRFFTDNFFVFQVIYTIVTFSLLVIFIERLTKNTKEKLFFLFSYYSYRFLWNQWVVLRQNISILLVWIALITFLKSEENRSKRNKWLTDLFLIFLATLFHYSAILILIIYLFYPLLKKIFSKLPKETVILISLILYFTSRNFYNILVSHVAVFSLSKYLIYSNIRGSNILNFLTRVTMFYIYTSINKDRKDNNYVFYSLFILLSSINAEIIFRISEYFAFIFYNTFYKVIRLYAERLPVHKEYYFFKNVVPIYLIVVIAFLMLVLIRFLFTFTEGQFLYFNFYIN